MERDRTRPGRSPPPNHSVARCEHAARARATEVNSGATVLDKSAFASFVAFIGLGSATP
jgi:hypothetical protein